MIDKPQDCRKIEYQKISFELKLKIVNHIFNVKSLSTMPSRTLLSYYFCSFQ